MPFSTEAITLSEDERAELEQITQSRTLPGGISRSTVSHPVRSSGRLWDLTSVRSTKLKKQKKIAGKQRIGVALLG
jgi:hypothetical protein